MLSMTHFEDLTPYSYLGPGENALNVGWLGTGHPFATGLADDTALTEVLRLVRDNPVNRMRGWHHCDLCGRPSDLSLPERPSPVQMELDGSPVFLGDCEIRVQARTGVVYAAPSLLAHYMAAHACLPPPEFLRALR
jgi:hypothetical protein